MSDAKKPADAKSETPKKTAGSSKAVLIAVFVCISSTLGAVFGQVALARMKPEKEKPDAAYEEKTEPLSAETIALDSIIVDLRTNEGELHHMKIGVALELSKPIPEEEQKKLVVRAKDAVITYARALTYDQVTDRDAFENIRKELDERIAKAIGRSRVAKILFTEFVVQ